MSNDLIPTNEVVRATTLDALKEIAKVDEVNRFLDAGKHRK